MSALLDKPFCSALAGLAVAALVWAAGRTLLGLDSVCLWSSLAGFPCWACGLGSGSVALVQGRFADAVAMHPLSPVVLALMLWCALRAAGELGFRPRRRPAPPSGPATGARRAP